MNQLPRQEFLAALARAHGTSLADPDPDDAPAVEQVLTLEWLRARSRAAADLQDRDVTARVTRALQREPELGSHAVRAKSRRGVVELRGFVTDDRLARRAELVAANVPGAIAVCDHLNVASSVRQRSAVS